MVKGAQALSNALPRPARSEVASGWNGTRVGVAVGVVLLAVAVLVAVANLRLSYRAAAQDVLDDAGRSAQRLASRLGRALDEVGQVTLVIKQLHDSGAGHSLQWMQRKGLLPERVVRVAMVADENGRIVDSYPLGMAISPDALRKLRPVRGRGQGSLLIGGLAERAGVAGPTFVMARRLEAPDGRFTGFVVALVPAQILLQAVSGEVGSGERYAVLDDEGHVHVQLEGKQFKWGLNWSIDCARDKVRESIRSHLPTPSCHDGSSRFFALSPVEGFALEVQVSVAADVALASYREWRDRVLVSGAGFVFLLLLASYGAMLQSARLERSRRRQLEAEAGLRATLEGSLDAVVILRTLRNEDGRLDDLLIVDGNSRAATLVSCAPGQLVGSRLSERVRATWRTPLLRQVEGVLATGVTASFELHTEDGEGRPRWLHHQVVAVGEGVALISRDISELKQASQALADQSNFLRKLLDYLPLPVYAKSVRVENEGRFLFWNQAAEQVFGLGSDRVVGHGVRELFAADLAARMERQDEIVLLTGRPMHFEEQAVEGPQGLRYISSMEVPLRESDGSLGQLLVIAQDVTEKRAQAQRMRLSARVLAETADGVLITDADDRIVELNPAFANMSGHAPAALLGRHVELLGLAPVRAASAGEAAPEGSGESQLLRADGSLLDVWLSASCIFEERRDRPSHHARVFSDISRLKKQEQALAALARSDALTGLANRGAFEERLKEALLRASRSSELLALIFLDLDGFKAVNDQFGHEAGDQMLINVARRLKDCVRAMDFVCRLGGDEFTIVLEQASSEEAMCELCQRIVEALTQTQMLGGFGVVATPSIGLAMALPGESMQSLLKRADLAMYSAKRAGKARYMMAESLPFADTTAPGSLAA